MYNEVCEYAKAIVKLKMASFFIHFIVKIIGRILYLSIARMIYLVLTRCDLDIQKRESITLICLLQRIAKVFDLYYTITTFILHEVMNDCLPRNTFRCDG